jgi:hypothetical protein
VRLDLLLKNGRVIFIEFKVYVLTLVDLAKACDQALNYYGHNAQADWVVVINAVPESAKLDRMDFAMVSSSVLQRTQLVVMNVVYSVSSRLAKVFIDVCNMGTPLEGQVCEGIPFAFKD